LCGRSRGTLGEPPAKGGLVAWALSCLSCPSRRSCPSGTAFGPLVRSPERLALLVSSGLPLVSFGVGRGGVFFPGPITLNDPVAREISTPCFWRTRNSSACAPGRGSSDGSTYAAGPSVRALRIDR